MPCLNHYLLQGHKVRPKSPRAALSGRSHAIESHDLVDTCQCANFAVDTWPFSDAAAVFVLDRCRMICEAAPLFLLKKCRRGMLQASLFRRRRIGNDIFSNNAVEEWETGITIIQQTQFRAHRNAMQNEWLHYPHGRRQIHRRQVEIWSYFSKHRLFASLIVENKRGRQWFPAQPRRSTQGSF